MSRSFDETTQLLASADRVFSCVRAECEGRAYDEPTLLHSVAMAWVNDYVDAGLVAEDDEAIEALTSALARLAGRLKHRRLTRSS